MSEAFSAGYEHGKASGSWVIDGNTDSDTAERIIAGYEDGDPEVLNRAPSPLSGEWADEPTPRSVLADLGLSEDDDSADDVLSEYEAGFSQGFWDEVIRAARIVAR